MFRTFTHTTVAATIVALLPGLASAQNFLSPYGSNNGRCGTSYYGASTNARPMQYGNQGCNPQSIAAGGCCGGNCSPQYGQNVQYGQNAPCAMHGIVNCQHCQGRMIGQPRCAQHGLVNCPQCQGGLNQQYPVQYNNGYGGSNYQPTQYPSNNPYFPGQMPSTNYRTRGNLQPFPMQPTWNAPFSPTYGNQNVSLY